MSDFWDQEPPTASTGQRARGLAVRVVAVVAVAALVGAAAWGAYKLLSGEKSTRKQVVQIALLAPPPPPPPPPPPEVKPPEPEVKEEVKVDEPKPEPTPEADTPPPGEQLGLDADGSGPGDGFGLAARKGGRDITDDTIGGKGNKSQFAWFSGQVQGFLQDQFLKNDKLRSADYRVVLRLWFGSDGRVERYELVNGTGNGEIDQTLKAAMADLPRMKVAVPSDLPQPLRIRITSRGAG